MRLNGVVLLVFLGVQLAVSQACFFSFLSGMAAGEQVKWSSTGSSLVGAVLTLTNGVSLIGDIP